MRYRRRADSCVSATTGAPSLSQSTRGGCELLPGDVSSDRHSNTTVSPTTDTFSLDDRTSDGLSAHTRTHKIFIIIIFIFWPTSSKWQARKLEVKQNNDHGVLLGVKCAQECNRISTLERYRQSLKQEHCFSRVHGDITIIIKYIYTAHFSSICHKCTKEQVTR